MDERAAARWLLGQEARALLTRVDRLRPYALHTPVVTAAALSSAAQTAMENHMIRGRRRLRALVRGFLRWLAGPEGSAASPAEVQRRFTVVRLTFNALISQFDIFADVLAQRSEYETGVWVAGLDDVAQEALEIPGRYYVAPPVICYLDRGHGAAIRRARTRLPGGAENPVAVVRVPRERMVGNGVASSLVHEVGHQAAELLQLVPSLRPVLRGMQAAGGDQRLAWVLWGRWISEIVADFWAIAKVGVAATLGLIGVVSLPRAFVFRLDLEDPHPVPWIRVKLSCALGHALYPHPQWAALARVWSAFYPPGREHARVLATLESTLPAFVALLLNHRPRRLRGRSLAEVMSLAERQPARLAMLYRAWAGAPDRMRGASPTLAFAVIGQARVDGQLTPEDESQILANLLTYWAVRSALQLSATRARPPVRHERPRAGRPGALRIGA